MTKGEIIGDGVTGMVRQSQCPQMFNKLGIECGKDVITNMGGGVNILNEVGNSGLFLRSRCQVEGIHLHQRAGREAQSYRRIRYNSTQGIWTKNSITVLYCIVFAARAEPYEL